MHWWAGQGLSQPGTLQGALHRYAEPCVAAVRAVGGYGEAW